MLASWLWIVCLVGCQAGFPRLLLGSIFSRNKNDSHGFTSFEPSLSPFPLDWTSLEDLRIHVMGHVTSISEEISSLNKNLTDITDSLAFSVKNITSGFTDRAATQVFEEVERVWCKFNETLSKLTASRPSVVILYSENLTLPTLQNLMRAEKQLALSGLDYHIIYRHRSQTGNVSKQEDDVKTLSALFAVERFSVIDDSSLLRFYASLQGALAPVSSPTPLQAAPWVKALPFFGNFFRPQDSPDVSSTTADVSLDHVILHWLVTQGHMHVVSPVDEVNKASVNNTAVADAQVRRRHQQLFTVSHRMPQQIWILDAETRWHGLLSTLLGSLRDNSFTSTDYLVVPRHSKGDSERTDFGPFDRRRLSGKDDVQSFLRSVFFGESAANTTVGATTSNTHSTNSTEVVYPHLLKSIDGILHRYSSSFFRFLCTYLPTLDVDLHLPLTYQLLRRYTERQREQQRPEQPPRQPLFGDISSSPRLVYHDAGPDLLRLGHIRTQQEQHQQRQQSQHPATPSAAERSSGIGAEGRGGKRKADVEDYFEL